MNMISKFTAAITLLAASSAATATVSTLDDLLQQHAGQPVNAVATAYMGTNTNNFNVGDSLFAVGTILRFSDKDGNPFWQKGEMQVSGMISR